jgi:alpha-glucoside transport system substrate-binding protein
MFALLVILSLLVASCGAEATPTTAPAPATATTAPVAAPTDTTAPVAAPTDTTAPVAAPTDTTAPVAAATATTGGGTSTGTMDWSKVGPEIVDAMAGKYKGTKVTLYGPFVGADETKFNNSMQDFEAKTGIDIQYEGTKTFEATINVRVEGGNPPDIADFPQPGLLASIAKSGKVQDANKMVNPDWLKQNYNQGYLDTATVAGPNGNILGGVFQRVNAKGLVFYPKKAFDAAGYKIPTTWDEQTALMDQIVADGDTPWCIGIGSDAATGWPATDWIENIMLRTTSLQNYDDWTTGKLPFTSPEVKHATEVMAGIWFNDKYVYGGRKQIVATAFGDSPAPMFQDPPKCWLHNQGNFITSYFETAKPGVQAGVDYDFYYLPPIDPQYGKPVEFGGDLMAAFADRPEVRAVMQYFSTFEGIKGWVAAGGAIAPQKDSSLSAYGTDFDRKVAQTLLDATSVRYDGSDLMPGAVGAGSFWKAMTDYVSGTVDIDQALQEAQAGWANVQK